MPQDIDIPGDALWQNWLLKQAPPASITERSTLAEVSIRWQGVAKPYITGNKLLVIDEYLGLILSQGQPIGVAFMVRYFVGGVEQTVDPHRVIINPPSVPRANLRYDVDGNRIVGAPAPEDAVIEALLDSL